MAKSHRKRGHPGKPKTNSGRLGRNMDREQNTFGYPADEFVTDSEIESREREQKKQGGRGKSH